MRRNTSRRSSSASTTSTRGRPPGPVFAGSALSIEAFFASFEFAGIAWQCRNGQTGETCLAPTGGPKDRAVGLKDRDHSAQFNGFGKATPLHLGGSST